MNEDKIEKRESKQSNWIIPLTRGFTHGRRFWTMRLPDEMLSALELNPSSDKLVPIVLTFEKKLGKPSLKITRVDHKFEGEMLRLSLQITGVSQI